MNASFRGEGVVHDYIYNKVLVEYLMHPIINMQKASAVD